MTRGILYAAFACSGAAALIYEITWTRLLTLFMGHTVAAASTVLAAFMGGLAIGAAVAGRIAPGLPRARALRAYAVVEIAIAAAALLLPLELDLLQPLVAMAYGNGDGGIIFGLVRLACALVVVTVPAIAMGATLPLMVRWDVREASQAGHDTGLLYAANTVGAASGAVLSGFVLLPALGMRGTTFVGVALNAVSAGVAWWLASRAIDTAAPAGEPAAQPASGKSARARRKPQRTSRAPEEPEPVTSLLPLWAVGASALALSGCVSLILQVAWTRILALVIGPTTYAFSAMVAVFIAGIALGSLAGGGLARRAPARAAAWLALTLFVAGIASAVAAAYATRVPLLVADAVASPDASFGTILPLQSMLVAALMLPMTVAFGAAFPLAVTLAARSDATVARDVSLVYAANTVGAIAGALAGGFLLVPWTGLEGTVRVAAALLITGFVLVALTAGSRPRLRPVAAAVGMAAILGLWLLPPWDRELLSSGAYKYAPYLTGPHRDVVLRAGRLLYYDEGAAGTVSVRQLTGSISLAIDGKVDASNAGDMLTQRLLAHVPLLLHPDPERVAIIGLGSGVTVGSALRHPIEQVDVIEVSPQVVEASAFFERENHQALADPRTRLIVGDGRTHLTLGTSRYDVVVSEPSNPWMAGIAALFTREFFATVRERLTPGGIFCQWAHTYDISAEDLRSIVATFQSVFPEAALFLVGEGDVLLIGSTESIEPRLATVSAAWSRPGVADDLQRVEVHDPQSLLSLYTAGAAALERYARGAAVQTDDGMKLEFSAPRGIYGRSTARNADTLRGLVRPADLPAAVREGRAAASTWTSRGRMQLRAEAYRGAYDDFAAALERNPRDEAAVDGLIRSAAPANQLTDAERRLRALLDGDPRHVAAAVGLSRLLAGRGDYAAAIEPLRTLFDGEPRVGALEQLASVFADSGDQARLGAAVTDLQRLAPEGESTLYYTASLHFLEGRLDDAIRTAEALRQRNPSHGRSLNLLGAAYATLGRGEDARRAFEASIQADPRDPATYTNLGVFELQAGRPAAAAQAFAEALTLDPSSASAQQGLRDALAAIRG